MPTQQQPSPPGAIEAMAKKVMELIQQGVKKADAITQVLTGQAKGAPVPGGEAGEDPAEEAAETPAEAMAEGTTEMPPEAGMNPKDIELMMKIAAMRNAGAKGKPGKEQAPMIDKNALPAPQGKGAY